MGSGSADLLLGFPPILRQRAHFSVRLRLAGQHWVEVPAPLSTLARAHCDQRRNTSTAANANCPWLFPGVIPGQHLSTLRLVDALRDAGIPVNATRRTTWQQLVRDAPPQVLVDTLGISPKTAMPYAEQAAADWTRYVGLCSRPPGHDVSAQASVSCAGISRPRAGR